MDPRLFEEKDTVIIPMDDAEIQINVYIYPPFRIILLKIIELQGFTRFNQKM